VQLLPRFRACLGALVLASAAAAQEPGVVRVRLSDPPRGGQVRLVLFDSAVTFGRFGQPMRVATFPADGRSGYELTDVPPGTYALVVHHDENANGQFDKNFIGIPTEPIAISRGYRPKGPPVYARASFSLEDGGERSFDLELFRVLGRLGLLGVGVGAVGRSLPYAGSEGGVVQPIPAVTYNGERLQWFGPTLRYSLVGSDQLRLAATASYRLRAYEESDSPVLAGMGDRDDTLMAGLALVGELPGGVDLALGYEHDVLDRIGGGAARLWGSRSLQWGVARFRPALALNWISADLADNDYGVPAGAATPQRPAYDVGDVWTFEAGVGAFVELSRDWRIVFDVTVEFLPGAVTNSPIVADDQVVKGFFALNYVI